MITNATGPLSCIILRPVEPEDDAFLFRLYCSTRETEFASLPLDEAQKQALMRMQFEGQKNGYVAQFPGAEHSILLENGESVGRIWVHETDNEIRIVDLAILTEFRGRGIGGTAVRGAMQRATVAGKPLRHVVLKWNEPALRFDLGLGYTVIRDDGIFVEMEWLPENKASAL